MITVGAVAAMRALSAVLVLCTLVLDGHDQLRFLLLAVYLWLVADSLGRAR